MKCPVCESTLEEGKRTCSKSCASYLAKSVGVANKIRREMGSKDKQYIREKLASIIKNHGCLVNNQPINVLDFWGGGIFADYLIDQGILVNNQYNTVLYEIDSNPQLYPALRDYANRKNQGLRVNNQGRAVHPVCSSLAKFIQDPVVNNQGKFDVIWLDYCGTIGQQEEQDIKLCKQVLKEDGILAITAFSAREKINFAHHREDWIKLNVNKTFPLFKLYKTFSYQNGHSPMKTYVFKGEKKKQKEVTMERFLEETGIDRLMFA